MDQEPIVRGIALQADEALKHQGWLGLPLGFKSSPHLEILADALCLFGKQLLIDLRLIFEVG
jgi:hypothetical protein